MKLDQLPSGLVIPEQPKPKPKPRAALEFDNPSDRRVALDALQSLCHLTHCGHIVLQDPVIQAARRRIVMALAAELLGPEWEPEEKC